MRHAKTKHIKLPTNRAAQPGSQRSVRWRTRWADRGGKGRAKGEPKVLLEFTALVGKGANEEYQEYQKARGSEVKRRRCRSFSWLPWHT